VKLLHVAGIHTNAGSGEKNNILLNLLRRLYRRICGIADTQEHGKGWQRKENYGDTGA
jgi:hypothetical protein